MTLTLALLLNSARGQRAEPSQLIPKVEAMGKRDRKRIAGAEVSDIFCYVVLMIEKEILIAGETKELL